MITLSKAGENLITLEEARQQIPGNTPAYSTVYRWTTVGCNGVRLDAQRVGKAIYTSLEALDRFIANQNGE
jgi:hypothetical protein